MSGKELQEIITSYERLRREGKQAALATLVHVSGSSYRRTGAHILISEDGSYSGTISGACLEQDLCEHASKLFKNNEQADMRLLRYDTSHDDDSIVGLGSGCSGAAFILLELLQPDSTTNPLRAFELASGDSASLSIIATIVKDSSNTESLFGSRFLAKQAAGNSTFYASACASSELRNEIEDAIIRELRGGHYLAEPAKSFSRRIQIRERKLVVFFELLPRPQRLVVFGAGHDVPALVEAAVALGMEVHVCDHRKAMAQAQRFPKAKAVLHIKAEGPETYPELDNRSCCVLMTHNYLLDKQILLHLLQSELAYLGVLGPKKRSLAMMDELTKAFPSLKIKTPIHGPAGLDIGADGPEQIAVSILAEILSVINKRKGGLLAERQAAIHDRQEEDFGLEIAEAKLIDGTLRCMQSRL